MDIKQVSVRLPVQVFRKFRAKCVRKSLQDNYTTQNKVLCQLVNMFNKGAIEMPWDK